MTAILMVMLAKMVGRGMQFFVASHKRSTASVQINDLMDTIRRQLGTALPSSVIIDTPTDPAAPPLSRIQFSTATTVVALSTITWSSNPLMNTVHLLSTQNNTVYDKILAYNVTGLMFTGDFRDPALVNVSVRMDIPIAVSTNVYTVILPNQMVRMSGK